MIKETEQDVAASEKENLENTQVVNEKEQTAKKKIDNREVLEYQILPMFKDTINFGI